MWVNQSVTYVGELDQVIPYVYKIVTTEKLPIRIFYLRLLQRLRPVRP